MLCTTPATLLLALVSGHATAVRPEAAPAPLVLRVDPVDDLRRRAERERSAPDARAATLEPPPGMDAAAVRELPEAGRGPQTPAGLSAERALAALEAKGAPATLAAPAAEPPAEEDLADAQKLYAAARQQAAEGKGAEALASLEEAAKLDPSSPEIWREIAACQNALGRRAAAVSAMQQAVRRGLADPASLASQGREAMRGARMDEALWLFTRAFRAAPADTPDAVTSTLQLAEALDRSGYATAASELYARGLSSRALSEANARGTPEIAELLRRRGELWQRAGDLSMRLGRVDQALTSYERAAAEPTLDAGALALRRVYAAVRLGRPAQAALAVVEKLRGPEASLEERELALIRYLADRTDIGPELSGAIGAVLTEGAKTPSARSRVVRAKAAALPLAARRAALVEHLASDPSDRRAAGDLLAGFGPDELEARTRALVAMVEKRPASADVYASLLLADGRGVRAAADALAKSSDLASRLLGGYLSVALGRGAAGLARLDPADAPDAVRPTVLGARADLAAMSGDYAGAQEALRQLEAGAPERTVQARVRALAALQRYPEALTAAAPLVDSPSADDRLLASALALQVGDTELAERVLVKLAEEDPQDERAADVLLRLYSARGPKADTRAMRGVIQRLREKVSSSRVLRFATASELVQRGQWAAAEQTLIGLAEEDPTSVGLLDLLALSWVRGGAASQERGEAWLRARLAAAPESVDAAAALAQVLAARGKAEEAVGLLDRLTEGAPIERLRRVREAITADALDNPRLARELAAARLAPAPRTIDATIAYCDALVGLERSEEAAPALRAGLPKDVPLTEDQKQRLTRLIAGMIQADADRIASGKPAAAGDAMTLLTELGLQTEPAVREAGLVLLALAEKPDLARIAAEYDKLGAQGAQEKILLVRLSRKVQSTKKPSAILPLMEALASQRAEPSADVLLALCVALGEHGGAADLRRLLPALTKGDRAERVLGEISNDPPPPPARQPGMIAYRIAGVASNQERYKEAAGLYEVAVELDPEHAIALNDYGYMLLEHDPSDKAKVEKLLERAYELEPTSYNIVDSLGWLRYKQGRFEDDPAKGAIAGAGALSLLKRAIELQQREQDLFEDPFIIDHYGDALWADGQRDAAVRQWQIAESKAQQNLQGRADNQADDPISRLYKKTIESTVAKRQAAKDGKEPVLEPRWAEPAKKP